MALPTHFDSLYIGGSWVKSVGDESAAVINPATEEVIGKAPVGTAAVADAAVAAARHAFDHGPWPKMAWRERAGVLQQFHDALMTRKEEIVQLCVAEAGSIVPVASIMQFDMAMDGLQYYIHQIERREFVIPSSVSAHTNWATGGETLGSTVKVYEPLEKELQATYANIMELTKKMFPQNFAKGLDDQIATSGRTDVGSDAQLPLNPFNKTQQPSIEELAYF